MAPDLQMLLIALVVLSFTGVRGIASANGLRSVGDRGEPPASGRTRHLLQTDEGMHSTSEADPWTATVGPNRRLLMTEAESQQLTTFSKYYIVPLADWFKKQGQPAGKGGSPQPSSTAPASPKPTTTGTSSPLGTSKPATSPVVSSGGSQPPASTPSSTPTAPAPTPSTPAGTTPGAQPRPPTQTQPPATTPQPQTPSPTPPPPPTQPQPQPAASPRSTTPPPPQPAQSPPSAQPPPSTTPSQPPPAPASSGGVGDPILKGVLDQHNAFRAGHQASALTWSTSLQDGAQKWADNCVFKHDNSGNGENLAMGYSTFSAGVQAWYDEVKDYNYNNPGFSMATGHFTQIVWKGTTQLGCGWNAGCKLYVCRYSPPGNVQGRFPENVAPAA